MMVRITASVALVAMTVFPHLSAQAGIGFCKEGTCSTDNDGCPSSTADVGFGFPTCAIIDTDVYLGGKALERPKGGKCYGYDVFLDIPQPDPTCTIIIRSPASVDDRACGLVVGAFKNEGCVRVVIKETFVFQFCCGTGDCGAAGVSKKMIRGMNFARGPIFSGIAVLNEDGSVVEPVAIGQAPGLNKGRALLRRDWEYTPEGEIFIRSGALQVVLTGVDGRTEVTIIKERSVSRSITFEAGIDWEIFSASVSIEFEETITNGNGKKFVVPAGQAGKVHFTPTLKCTKGSVSDCGDGPTTGEACTGYEEAGEIASTYAVTAIT